MSMVEWKPLHSIVKSVSTGLNPRDNFVLNEEGAEFYYVTVKEITTNNVVFSDSTDRITTKAKAIINNRSKLGKGDILFSGIGTIGKVAYVDTDPDNWDCSESVFIIKPCADKVRGKYLAYILSSNIAKNQYERGAAGAIMKGVRKQTLVNLLIPIPSLSEQQRIVSILDTFTSSISNLKQQIEERRKQYEYERDRLLDLEGKEGVEMKPLKEVFDTRNGYTPSTKEEIFWTNGNIPWFKMEDIRDNGGILSDSNLHITPAAIKGKGLFKANSIILATSATIGEHALITVQHLCNQRFTNFYPNTKFVDKVDMKYVYYYMFIVDEWCKQHVNQGGFASVDMTGLYNLPIPLPSLYEQQRIVSFLDSFEVSIKNLEEQLALREKQYEYYRNQLLTFE